MKKKNHNSTPILLCSMCSLRDSSTVYDSCREGPRHLLIFRFLELLKSGLRYVLANGQTVRWVTQKPVLAKLIADSSPVHIAFDIGCGGGTYAIELLAPIAELVIALDIDYYHAWLTRERVRRKGLRNVHVVVASAETLPFKAGVADLVLCSEVLEHLAQDKLAVSELARIAKPNMGVLVVSVPHPPEPCHNPGHFREGYTTTEICSLLASYGFEVERQEFCMFTLTRIVLRACAVVRVPLPLLWLCQFERLLSRWIGFSDPYNLAVRARRRGMGEHENR